MTQATTEGRSAFTAGKALADNPWPEGSPHHGHWRMGWRLAKEARRIETERLCAELPCTVCHGDHGPNDCPAPA